MNSPIVIAKREAARAWVGTVNASDSVHDKWAYLLASETVTSAANGWVALKIAGEAYR